MVSIFSRAVHWYQCELELIICQIKGKTKGKKWPFTMVIFPQVIQKRTVIQTHTYSWISVSESKKLPLKTVLFPTLSKTNKYEQPEVNLSRWHHRCSWTDSMTISSSLHVEKGEVRFTIPHGGKGQDAGTLWIQKEATEITHNQTHIMCPPEAWRWIIQWLSESCSSL